jgi:hypothetical protein
LVIRTHLLIPAWKNQGAVLKNDLENYPECSMVYNNYGQWIMATGGTLSNSRLNELGMNLFRSEEIDPKAWEVQMNIAAFFAMVGHWEMAYERTLKSIALLEPLGGIRQPMDALLTQKATIEKKLAENKQKAEAGELGSPNSLSHPTAGNVATPQEAGREDDKGQRNDTEQGVLESVGIGRT